MHFCKKQSSFFILYTWNSPTFLGSNKPSPGRINCYEKQDLYYQEHT